MEEVSPAIRIRVPANAQAIREAFRANLEERQKKLINQSYQAFGTTNATELMRRFVPKSTLRFVTPKQTASLSLKRHAFKLS